MISCDRNRVGAGQGVRFTTGSGKFYSNTLIGWLATATASGGMVHRPGHQMLRTCARGGHPPSHRLQPSQRQRPRLARRSMLGIAHDFGMRVDSGYFCFPEVEIQSSFSPGEGALFQAKLTPAAAVEAMITGAAYGRRRRQAIGLVTDVQEGKGQSSGRSIS